MREGACTVDINRTVSVAGPSKRGCGNRIDGGCSNIIFFIVEYVSCEFN